MSVDTLIAQYGIAATTQRPTTTRDSTGSIINTYTNSLTTLTVYLQQNGGAETDMMGAQRNTLTAVGYVPVGSAISPQDRLFVGTAYWDVQEVRTPDERSSADGSAHMRLSLTRTLPL
jgi:head-tail adaptor